MARRTHRDAPAYWHITFHPYRRHNALCDDAEEIIRESVRAVAARLGIAILGIAIMPDHVHIVLDKPHLLPIRQVIGQIKGRTARDVLREIPELRFDLGGRGLWAPGYHYVRHDEESLPVVRAYVRSQKAKAGFHDQ